MYNKGESKCVTLVEMARSVGPGSHCLQIDKYWVKHLCIVHVSNTSIFIFKMEIANWKIQCLYSFLFLRKNHIDAGVMVNRTESGQMFTFYKLPTVLQYQM